MLSDSIQHGVTEVFLFNLDIMDDLLTYNAYTDTRLMRSVLLNFKTTLRFGFYPSIMIEFLQTFGAKNSRQLNLLSG